MPAYEANPLNEHRTGLAVPASAGAHTCGARFSGCSYYFFDALHDAAKTETPNTGIPAVTGACRRRCGDVTCQAIRQARTTCAATIAPNRAVQSLPDPVDNPTTNMRINNERAMLSRGYYFHIINCDSRHCRHPRGITTLVRRIKSAATPAHGGVSQPHRQLAYHCVL